MLEQPGKGLMMGAAAAAAVAFKILPSTSAEGKCYPKILIADLPEWDVSSHL